MLALGASGDQWIPPSRKTLLYISGAISPTKMNPSLEENIKRLYETTWCLFEEGYSVYCPAQEWITRHVMQQLDNRAVYEQIMCMDFDFVRRSDVLYMLPNWRESSGAVREHNYARAYSKPVIYGVFKAPVAPHDPVWDVERWT